MAHVSPTPVIALPRPGRRTSGGRVPLVPLWFVCTRRHWRACESTARLAPAPRQRGAGGFRIALHADVGESALRDFGPCRSDLVAVALDPRRLPGEGPRTCVRADLDVAGRARLRIECASLATDAVVAVEPLRPLDDDAGYHPPALRTAGDGERARDRDGFRRTRR